MREETKGTLLMAVSAVFFSIGGLFIKLIPWEPLAINGIRCLIAALVFGIYMKVSGKKFHFNKIVILGALAIAGTACFYNLATKFTTAGNAIMLEYSSPVFIIAMSYLIFRKKPTKADLFAAGAVMFGIFWFFLDSLSTGHFLGNAFGLCAALCVSIVYLLKLLPKADIASSVFFGLLLNGLLFTPFAVRETVFTPEIFFYLALLGIFQLGFAYVFFHMGLSRCQPLPAVLAGSVEPLLNPILVAIFYGEVISTVALPGIVIVFVSIILYNFYMVKAESADPVPKGENVPQAQKL